MHTKKDTLSQVLPISLLFGLIGTALLIGMRELEFFSKAYFEIIPIPIVMILAVLRIKKVNPTELNFNKAFLTGFLTYIIVFISYFIYVKLYIESVSFALLDGSILILLALNLIIASISSAILALIIKRKPVTETNTK